MNEASKKSLAKRLFAIFLLILALSVMIGMPDSAIKQGITPQSVQADEKNGKITIRVVHDFDGGGAEVILQKKDTEGDTYTDVSTVSIGTAVGNFVYDLDSTEYDSFYIKKVDDSSEGNRTVSVTTETLIAKKGVYGSSFAVKYGNWTGSVRPLYFGVPIAIKHDFTGGATVCYVKGNTLVTTEALPSDGTLLFDLESSDYDGFYIKETGNDNIANSTVILDRDKIIAALEDGENSSGGGILLTAVVGNYVANTQRTLKLLEPGSSIADTSLNIPEGVFEKEDGIWYVNSTFYDYYSDLELEGTNRKTVSDDSMGGDGSSHRIQARKFNQAIDAYFQGTSLAASSWQSPLYFGEFTNAGTYTSGLLNFKFDNNNGNNNQGARLGLVNSQLIDDKLMMGTDNDGDGVEVPYFNKQFLRGDNSLQTNIGYVFENISFPFVKDTATGYWEFESYDASQTLRMKQTAGGEYFLDRVGAANSVHGHTAYVATTESNFFPFNDTSESGQPTRLNYAFGMRLDIPFYMTANGKVKVKEGDTIVEKDIEFKFNGDDDIWVFIDGNLILDIGGDHGAVDGSINFATATAVTTGCRSTDGTENNKEYGAFTTSFEKLDSSEQHVLTLFYMERGLWESNMFISFNFPKTNNLEIEKEVVTTGADGQSLVNAEFEEAMDRLKTEISFPIAIRNMITSGDAFDIQTAETALQWDYDAITPSTSGEFIQSADGSELELVTADIPGNDGSRDCVLKYRYPGEKKYTDGQDVTDGRSFLLPNNSIGNLSDSDAARVEQDGYLELDAYLDAATGAGAPFVALIDGAGNRIGVWANDNAVVGTRGLMQSGNWASLRIYFSQMEKLNRLDGSESGGFQYTNIASIQIGYWDDKTVYIDNITLNAPPVYEEDSGFEKEQDKIPDYGSYASRGLEPINGAKYSMDGKDYYVESGRIYLENDQSAIFSDQFRRNSYLMIQEECDENVFDVTWTLSEGDEAVRSGSGTGAEDERERDTSLTEPEGISKPEGANTILFRTYEEGANDNQYFDLKLKYTNTIKTGSLRISKWVKVSEGSLIDQEQLIDVTIPYTIRVTFSNVGGMYLEGSVNDYGEYESSQEVVIEQNVFLEPGQSVFTITGIPAGTEYRVEEVQTAGDNFPLQEAGLERDDFSLSAMYRLDGGNDTGEFDADKKYYRGTIVADGEEIIDNIVVVNDINPVIEMAEMGGEKLWDLGNENSHLDAAPQAQSVMLKLQRRFLQTAGDITNGVTYDFQDVTYIQGTDSQEAVVEILLTKPPDEGEPDKETQTLQCTDGNSITIETEGWAYHVEGLPLYGKSDAGRRRKYEYRFVETKIVTEAGEFDVISEDDDSGNPVYQANQSGYLTSGGTASVTEDEEGAQIEYNLTNTYNPLTNLEVTKVSGDDPPEIMEGVTLQLERYVKDGEGWEKDDTFECREEKTDADGKVLFEDLPDGRYQLTETETIENYSLLARPIELVINRAGESTVEGMKEALEVQEDKESGKMLITLTISNQGLLMLPATGGNLVLYILGAEFLSLAGCGLYFAGRHYQKKESGKEQEPERKKTEREQEAEREKKVARKQKAERKKKQKRKKEPGRKREPRRKKEPGRKRKPKKKWRRKKGV